MLSGILVLTVEALVDALAELLAGGAFGLTLAEGGAGGRCHGGVLHVTHRLAAQSGSGTACGLTGSKEGHGPAHRGGKPCIHAKDTLHQIRAVYDGVGDEQADDALSNAGDAEGGDEAYHDLIELYAEDAHAHGKISVTDKEQRVLQLFAASDIGGKEEGQKSGHHQLIGDAHIFIAQRQKQQ